MRIVAEQNMVARYESKFVEVGRSPDGWTATFVDPTTDERWQRIYLGSEYHGGGMPILLKEPMPSVDELLSMAADSLDSAELAASAWLLADQDLEGRYKDRLVAIAEELSIQGHHARAALVVAWGDLMSDMNLRPTLGKSDADITKDHTHFCAIAARARMLLQIGRTDQFPRDPAVFGHR